MMDGDMTLARSRAISADPLAAPRLTRILLRSPKDPFQVVEPEQVLHRNLIGTNAGNLVFLQATWKILGIPGVTIEPDGLSATLRPEEVNERFDAYVIPLANAFRLSFETQLLQMAAMIRRLRIPVIVLGVGAQADLNGNADRLRPIERSVRAFVDAVLDHAPSIGVRGEITYEYLRGLGYRDVEVIGCPSMFLYGPDLRVVKRLPALGLDARISLNVSPYVREMGPIVARHVARYPNLTYVPQDAEALGLLLLGGRSVDGSRLADIPDYRDHPLFAQDRVRFYVEPWPWIEDLRSVDFAFGSRIHGNIAAILAGTPAYVLAHDSRTLELARYFAIPHRPLSEVGEGLDAADLYDEADYARLGQGQAARFATFAGFLRQHGIGECFTHGDGGAAFDARLARTSFPQAVGVGGVPVRSHDAKAAVGRLRHRLYRLARSGPVRRLHRALVRRQTGRQRRSH